MASGGDWVIPHLNGLAYIEKPPLQYWATALALRVFGATEFAARFYTALCALATVVAVWVLARRLWGQATAWRAAAVLGSMLLFLCMGQLLTLDMSLTLYMTVALAAFLLAQSATPATRPASPGRQCGAGAPLHAHRVGSPRRSASSPKGLVAAAIPAAVLVLYSLYARDFAPWRRLHVSIGLPLFLLIAVPWHWLAARRLPDFLQFFFVHEHLARYLTPSADREETWWFFGVVFLLGSVPWTLAGPASHGPGMAAARAARDIRSRALSLDLGAVRVRVLLTLRFEAHSLHPAGDAGARRADCRLADAAAATRRAADGVLDRGCGDRAGAALHLCAQALRAVQSQRLFLLAREAARRDRGAARRIRACTYCRSGAAT